MHFFLQCNVGKGNLKRLQYPTHLCYIYEKVSEVQERKDDLKQLQHDCSISYNWRLCRWQDHLLSVLLLSRSAMSMRDISYINSERYCHLQTSQLSCVWEIWNEREEAEDFSRDAACVLYSMLPTKCTAAPIVYRHYSQSLVLQQEKSYSLFCSNSNHPLSQWPWLWIVDNE